MKLLLVAFVLTTSLYFVSCSRNTDEKYLSTSLSDSVSTSGLAGDSVKLVKTAGMTFKVKDVEKSARAISGLARKSGGMIYDQTYEAPEEGRNELKISPDSIMVVTTYMPQADMTVRVPSENLEEFMYNIADLGYFTGSSRLHIDDKSIGYLENVLKQKNRREVLTTHDLNKSKSFTDAQTVAVKDEITNQQIANRIIDADVNYSSVHLNLFQNSLVRKEIIANYVTSDYQLPFGKRLSNALSDGWQYFLGVVIALANLWMFILLTIAIVIGYKFAQQRSKVVTLKLKNE
ncbi:MAG: DUF4349 domain-containing protein [Ginsengibacter sp.]